MVSFTEAASKEVPVDEEYEKAVKITEEGIVDDSDNVEVRPKDKK